jgi:phosphoglycerate dehydrogenase-like enzyme
MDEHLKLLADASIDMTAAEEALDEDAFQTARERLDSVDVKLEQLRRIWLEMSTAERVVITPSAKEIRARLDAAAKRVPKVSALSQGAEEVDPEQETEPGGSDA